MIKIFHTKKTAQLPIQLVQCKNPVFLFLKENEEPILLREDSKEFLMFKEFWESGHLSEVGLKLSDSDMIPLLRAIE